MIVLGSLLGAAMGLILGTYVPPNRISVTLTLVLTPLIFTGSSQYPWPSLGHLRWFQVVSALNPMTYVSEGLRGLMAPGVPHIQTWICFVVAVGSLVVLMAVGMVGVHPARPRVIPRPVRDPDDSAVTLRPWIPGNCGERSTVRHGARSWWCPPTSTTPPSAPPTCSPAIRGAR